MPTSRDDAIATNNGPLMRDRPFPWRCPRCRKKPCVALPLPTSASANIKARPSRCPCPPWSFPNVRSAANSCSTMSPKPRSTAASGNW